MPEKELTWLHKLRPWPGHNEHFHVRLFCPTDSLHCEAQDEIPPGDGCSEVVPPRMGAFPESHTEEHLEESNEWFEALFNEKRSDLPPACFGILKAAQEVQQKLQKSQQIPQNLEPKKTKSTAKTADSMQ